MEDKKTQINFIDNEIIEDTNELIELSKSIPSIYLDSKSVRNESKHKETCVKNKKKRKKRKRR